ncbi:MAG: CPBP family intramembrane metalloprotease [Butyrivibrio sp.]|nr:CPBP family intramembrane metalloprotease [Butyrivibrio sp.]
MHKKENAGIIIWRFAYPLLIFFGVELLVETAFMYGHMFRMIGAGAYSFSDTDAMAKELESYIYGASGCISVIRAAVLAPIYILFMRADKRRDAEYGRIVKYSPYNRLWLLLLPVIGFASAVGFNHMVPMLLEALQSFIHILGKSVFGTDWSVDFFAKYNEISGIIYTGPVWVLVLSIAVAAPILEELLYRGLIFKRLRAYLKPVPSMLISAFVFGIMHGNAVQFVYAFILGIFMAFVYEKFKTVYAPMIFHAGANLTSLVITLVLPESGYTVTIGTYMLLTVVELAVAFLLLKLVDVKVDRRPEEINNR